MRNEKGQFIKGHSSSPNTQFKNGEHWRTPQQFREKSYLEAEYLEKKRSTGEIAEEFGVTDAAIIFWLKRYGIPRRSISEARAEKHWGVSGEDNPMFGRTGADSPQWKGGCTPERQAFYASLEWSKVCALVWRRDKAICQRCGEKSSNSLKMHIHHIAPFAVRELRAEPTNLLLICETCHHWIHSKKNKYKEFIEEGRS